MNGNPFSKKPKGPVGAAGIFAWMLALSSPGAVAFPHIDDDQLKQITGEQAPADDKVKPKSLIEGYLWIGDPVHENLTKVTLKHAAVFGNDTDIKKTPAYQLPYIRGVFWNDDPTKLLWPTNAGTPQSFLNGATALEWAQTIKRAEKIADTAWLCRDTAQKVPCVGNTEAITACKAKKKQDIEKCDLGLAELGKDLLSRSHFGDLQFLHGMAGKEGEKASDTKAHMLTWAEFCFKVAGGAIAATDSLKQADAMVPGISRLLVNDTLPDSKTIAELFGDSNIKELAEGSLLHMIQDSFSDSHVKRVVLNRTSTIDGVPKDVFARDAILRFYTYPGQDKSRHKQCDKEPSTLFIAAALINVGSLSGSDPVTHGIVVAKLLRSGNAADLDKRWSEAGDYLSNKVFNLNTTPAEAGPGRPDCSP